MQEIYTKQETDELLKKQADEINARFFHELKKLQNERIPKWLSTAKMAHVLGISQPALRQRVNKQYFINTHFFKRPSGRIMWDKDAVLNERT